ncbi:hypothetical protein O3G_MSEX011979 [Manduca sexta]|uniref:Peptidase S1 domain-containing protein n=1 Tax=Manduca sexta TaxID=7130 RepID=A0A921ZM73_MANSE|nr:hypothetical protein O3G_MSEX011979 [Manduca sexta]
MRLLFLFFFASIGIPAPFCDGGKGKISRGRRVHSISPPWHVGLYKVAKRHKQICGGSIVTTNAVLTAAHCFSQGRDMPSPTDYAVAAGKLYRGWNNCRDTTAQKSQVKEIKVPPHYQGIVANFQDDIAVVFLVKPFNFSSTVAPAGLSFDPDFDKEQLKEGEWGKVVGWGLTDENSPPSEMLQEASLPFIPIERCIDESPVSFRSSITGDKICAGYTNGTAVCRGDSGGGLVFFSAVKDHEDYHRITILRGIVSTSPTSNNECNIYTWATFTHLLKHEHFLKSVLPDLVEESIMPKILIKYGVDDSIQGEHYEKSLQAENCNCVCPTPNC